MYDVVIVGAGTGGLAALREVRKSGRRFLLINDGPWGTTCARVGCMPSKTLIEAANAHHRRHTFQEFGLRGWEQVRVDAPAVLARVRRLRDRFVAGALRATDDLDVEVLNGRATMEGPGILRVEGRVIRARSIILAPGSRPWIPPQWAPFAERLVTTDTLFELPDLPERMAVVGMGPVGAEMAQALSRLGVEVHAFDRLDTVAGVTDPVVLASLLDALRDEFPVHLGAPAVLEAGEGGVKVVAGAHTVMVDRVLVAMGRRPAIDGLGLEALGLPLDDNGLPPVDPGTLRVGDLPVFLVGDANGNSPVLHEGADEGHIAGRNAVADPGQVYLRRIPLRIVFTEPGVARVGRPWADLGDTDAEVGEFRFERDGRAIAAQRDRGVIRIYADRTTCRVLGAELCAPAGEHLAHFLGLAVQNSLTVREVLGAPFYHPVLEEGLRSALRDLSSRLPSPGTSDLEDGGLESSVPEGGIDTRPGTGSLGPPPDASTRAAPGR